MLNELLAIERGAREAHIEMIQRHPDIKEGRRMPTLLVQLGSEGSVSEVRILPDTTIPWTLRDGQHNSFPFVQPKSPLLVLAKKDRDHFKPKSKPAGRRAEIFDLLRVGELNLDGFSLWPGKKLLRRLHERRLQLRALTTTPAEVALATIDRFLLACDPQCGGDSGSLIRQIVEHICAHLKTEAQDAWDELAVALLIGRETSGGRQYECTGAFVFDSAGYSESISATNIGAAVSDALRRADCSDTLDSRSGVCALAGGEPTALVNGNFPQPNVAVLGQTYLFAKNKDVPANDRYGRFAANALSVGKDLAIRLAAALEALTTSERRGITWRPVPSELAKDSDLLLAFVHANQTDPSVAELMEETDDLSEEAPPTTEDLDARISHAFESKTRPVVDSFDANKRIDPNTTVDLVIFRKIDPANRKVIYSETTTIGSLRDAVARWIEGERNVPKWLRLPIPVKKGGKPLASPPLLVSPMSLIGFSKSVYLRGGTEKQLIVGIPAAESLAIFLERIPNQTCPAAQRVRRFLHLALTRRRDLLSGTAHALRRGLDHVKDFDRREALRTVTVLGIILEKLGSTNINGPAKEVDMESKAFQFGQLLAAVDVLHVGYCADVRKGDVPPTLLGNQVFAIAQVSPKRALDVLGERLAPYLAWATRAARDRRRIEGLVNSKNREESQRGWEIRKAIRQAREVRPIARRLAEFLPDAASEDADLFKARLVLGYIAGIPPRDDKSDSINAELTAQSPMEET